MAAATVRPINNMFCYNETNKSEDKMNPFSLMNRLRLRHSHKDTWIETTKLSHLLSNDNKKTAADLSSLHQHLETLLKSIKAVGRLHLVDRLESIARDLNLTFTVDGSKESVCLSDDDFAVKLFLDSDGNIVSVHISHNSDTKSCMDLVKSLNAGNFSHLRRHLEGLIMLYSIDGDRQTKSKAAQSLLSLESDLNTLSKWQSSISSVQSYIHKSPLGVVISRVGGLPMKLTYFVGPYDLLNYRNKTMTPMTLEAIIDHSVGSSLRVGIEPSAVDHRILTRPLTSKITDGRSLPISSTFCPLTNQNSCLLPARFVLHLDRPLVVSSLVMKRIQRLTGLDVLPGADCRPLVGLLVEQVTRGKTKAETWQKYSHVTLCDQFHEYYFGGDADLLRAVVVSKIPFLHPTDVPLIITQLRQQVLFNTVILSCLRRGRAASSTEGNSRSVTFEVTPLSLQHVTVTFEHPSKCSLVTAELDLSDMMALGCKVVLGPPDDNSTSNYATHVFQRCLSLPVTLRALLRRSSATTPAGQTFSVPSFLRLQHLSRLLGNAAERRRRDDDASRNRQKKPDPHTAMKNSAPLFIASSCMNSSRRAQLATSKRTQVLGNPVLSSLLNDEMNGVKRLQSTMSSSSSQSCWGTSAENGGGGGGGGRTENQLKRFSEDFVAPIAGLKVVGVGAKECDRKASSGLGAASHSALGMLLDSAAGFYSSSGAAFIKSEIQVSRDNNDDAESPQSTRDAASTKDSKTTSFGDRPPTRQPKDPKPFGDLSTASPVATNAENMNATLRQKSLMPLLATQTSSSSYSSASSSFDSVSSQDFQRNAAAKRPRQPSSNPELISILSDLMPGDAPPPPKRPLLASGVVKQERRSPISAVVDQSSSTTKTSSSIVYSRSNDVEAFVDPEARTQRQNAAIETVPPNWQNSSNDRLKTADYTNSSAKDAEKGVVAACYSSKSNAATKRDENGTANVSDVARVAVKTEVAEPFDGFSASQRSTTATSSSTTTDDKPPIIVTINKSKYTTVGSDGCFFETGDHGLSKYRGARERKLNRPALPVVPDIDLTADSEVDSLTSDDLLPFGQKMAPSDVFILSQQMLRDRKEAAARLGKRPPGPKVPTGVGLGGGGGGEPGEKRPKKSTKKTTMATRMASDFDEDDDSSGSGSGRPLVERIKITTTSGGKLQIQNPAKKIGASFGVLPSAGSSGRSPTAMIRNPAPPMASSLRRPASAAMPGVSARFARPAILTSRVPNCSKSDSGFAASSPSGATDSKLNRTPTIKLKPVTMPVGQAGCPTTSGGGGAKAFTKVASFFSSGGGGGPATATPPGNRVRLSGGATADAKLARKGSLSSVIDSLHKKQTTPICSPFPPVGSSVDQQKILDAIRLQIIREGTKPSTPTFETSSGGGGLAKSSSVAQPAARKSSLADASRSDVGKSPDVSSSRSFAGSASGAFVAAAAGNQSATTQKASVPSRSVPNGSFAKNAPLYFTTTSSLPPFRSSSTPAAAAGLSGDKPRRIGSPTVIAKPPREKETSLVPVVGRVETLPRLTTSTTTTGNVCGTNSVLSSLVAGPTTTTMHQIVVPVFDAGGRTRLAVPPPSLLTPPPGVTSASTNVTQTVRMMAGTNAMSLPPPPRDNAATSTISLFMRSFARPPGGMQVRMTSPPPPAIATAFQPPETVCYNQDRLATARHFMDVVSVAPTEENVVGVERRLSPPRSPSPVNDATTDFSDDRNGGASYAVEVAPLKVVDFNADDIRNVGEKSPETAPLSSSQNDVSTDSSTQKNEDGSTAARKIGSPPKDTKEESKEESTTVELDRRPIGSLEAAGSGSLATGEDLSAPLLPVSVPPSVAASSFEDRPVASSDADKSSFSICRSETTNKSSSNLTTENDVDRSESEKEVATKIGPNPSSSSSSHNNSICSPSSEDHLVIDYPSTPKTSASNADPAEEDVVVVVVLSPSQVELASPSWHDVVKSSSPTRQNSHASSPLSNGVCDLEDELMDAALTL